jgi:S1-C subfamily serine protease
LLVVSLDNGGPAEKAGVRGVKRHRYNLVLGDLVRSDYSTADIITQANGQDVKTVDDLLAIVESCRAGEYVKLSIVREGLQKIISILLVEERSSEADGKD